MSLNINAINYFPITDQDLNENEFIFTPIITRLGFIKKFKEVLVYFSDFDIYKKILSFKYSLPIYLPEIGLMLALDLTSESLASELYKEIKEFSSLFEGDRIFVFKIHNYDNKINRAVSWGNLRSFRVHEIIPENVNKIYQINIKNDLNITPCLIAGSKNKYGIYTPIRYTNIIIEKKYKKIETNLNYNFSIIYIKKEYLNKSSIKTRRLPFDKYLELFEVKAGLIGFKYNGEIKYKEVNIHFTENPLEIETLQNITYKGGYFKSYLLSLNDLRIHYAEQFDDKYNINIVDQLEKLIYSRYDILPLLFPYYYENEKDRYNLIYEFSVKKSIYLNIINIFQKYSGPQNQQFIENFDKTMEEENKCIKIMDKNDNILIQLINPSLIPFLIKKILIQENEEYFEDIFQNDIMKKASYYNKVINRKIIDITALNLLAGINNVLEKRKKLYNYLLSYIKNIAKN
jgi:hypothetical protein